MLGLGIDAGGTYTDTAIVDLDTGKVLSGNKALTTRNDLSVGIRESIAGLDLGLLKDIALTSLSSTLATNSVVEGKGCRVGLICIGKPYLNETSPEFYFHVDGRFQTNGEEEESLGVRQISEALAEMKGKVDALAIAGYMSVRNPSHEVRCAKMAQRELDVPVVLAHTLTSKLGFQQRATTAVMNARLIPTIKELLASVKKVLSEFGIRSPLMIVKGDGSVMSEDVASDRPVETILSGPASSITGARGLTGLKDAAVVDVGGTTCDVGILRNGVPKIDPEGARIAGMRTRVMAAEVSTYGIGGDSRILVNGNRMILSTVRAIPICIAASKWPSVREAVSSLEGVTERLAEDRYPVQKVLQSTEFFTFTHEPAEGTLSSLDLMFLDRTRGQPARVCDVAAELDVPPHSFNIALMESRGIVTRIAVTPTDILEAEGTYTEFDPRPSEICVSFLARKCGVSPEGFIEHAKTAITRRMAECIMETMLLRETGADSLGPEQRFLMDHILGRHEGYSLSFGMDIPIIGIGAPTAAWLPRVAEMLGTELILPEHSSIGNAIGAITGYVSEIAEVSVRAVPMEPVEDPECEVYTGKTIRSFPNPAEALEFAQNEGIRMAVDRAVKSGARNPEYVVTMELKEFQINPEKKVFRGANLLVRATGKPDLGTLKNIE